MNMEALNFTRVYPKEKIDFKCTCCGACCRQVEKSVPVESHDAFRIAKYLHGSGLIQNIVEFYSRYAEPVFLDACGYTVYFLKSIGEEKACIFLKEGRCQIHKVKPRACRLYPFVVSPEDGTYYLSREKAHHFTGGKVQVKRWMKKNCSKTDKLFTRSDYGAAPEIAKLLREIPEKDKDEALMAFMIYKYWEFDLDKPFLEQHETNQKVLMKELERLAKQQEGKYNE